MNVINNFLKYLSENTNLFLDHSITTYFIGQEKKNLRQFLDGLYQDIEHGDNEHRLWLKEKIDNYFNSHKNDNIL